MSDSAGSSFSLATPAPGVLAISGVLSFDTAAAALDAMRAKLADGGVNQLDLAGLQHSDSAGLSCILALAAECSARGKPLHMTHLPLAMRALAQVSGVEAMIA